MSAPRSRRKVCCPHCHRVIPPTPAAERAAERKRKQGEQNADRRARGCCLWCDTPTELNRRTGRPKALCPVHLAAVIQNKALKAAQQARLAAHWAAESARKRA